MSGYIQLVTLMRVLFWLGLNLGMESSSLQMGRFTKGTLNMDKGTVMVYRQRRCLTVSIRVIGRAIGDIDMEDRLIQMVRHTLVSGIKISSKVLG